MPHVPPVVALLTDFGLDDPYVGQMKAVLAARLPMVRILDLSHGVPAHDILAGAFFLAASMPWLPVGSVTAAVVDPGVGTTRRIIGLAWRERLVLAPDNGLVSLLMAAQAPSAVWDFRTPADAAATFHGRDVFAPLAAALCGGAAPDDMGRPVDPGSLCVLPDLAPRLESGLLHCRILHADRFGNLVLGLALDRWRPMVETAAGLSLKTPAAFPLHRVAAYADIPSGALGLLAGSQGYFELAAPCASAAAVTGLGPGHAVTLSFEAPSATRGKTF